MKKSRAQVQGTNDYNTVSKCSMVRNGYFSDKYVSCFVTKYNRRTPLIHLGYYMRMLSVDFTLSSFLKMTSMSKQIISFGAGFDTTFFRFADNGVLGTEDHFFEVDFEEVVERKRKCILNSEPLQNCVGSLQEMPAGIKGFMASQYRLIASDLQNVGLLELNLKAVGVKFHVPTLILAEVAICYMDEESSTRLIEWAASSFEDATFVTYEQVYPDDGFGIVMQKHFENMKSPLLSLDKYPTLQSQERRYVSQGWSSCQTWTAFEMFLGIASPEEKRRIITLEPFDEFEEWHLEGCHFALIVASKGNLADWFLKYMVTPCQRVPSKEKRKQIKWYLSSPSVCRFAHRSLLWSQDRDSSIQIFGGFGPSSEFIHGRRHEVLNICTGYTRDAAINKVDMKKAELCIDMKLDALHHTCTRLSIKGHDGSIRMFIYGGRYSPCKAVNTCPSVLEINPNGQAVTAVRSFVGASVPPSRWRHSATCFTDGIKDYVAVFGGRSSEMEVMDDMYIWTVEASDMNIFWKEVKHKSDSLWPAARFSHSAALWKDTIVLCGGLGKNILPLGDVCCFNVESETWFEIPVCGMLPRYSHTSVIQKDKMVLYGGVNTLPGRQPGVCVVDLIQGSCIEYALPAQDPEHPILLHNHTTELINDSEAVIIGGGGNCFSFGTVFNTHLIRTDLRQFQ